MLVRDVDGKGVNTYTDPDYTNYAGNENFMDLDHNRSSEFNLNLFWQGIPLQKKKGFGNQSNI